MKRQRTTTCKVCGASRCEWADMALCYEHWCEYQARASWEHYHRANPDARVTQPKYLNAEQGKTA